MGLQFSDCGYELPEWTPCYDPAGLNDQAHSSLSSDYHLITYSLTIRARAMREQEPKDFGCIIISLIIVVIIIIVVVIITDNDNN